MADKEDVRNRLDIVDFIGQSIQLKRAGRNFKGLCPFHKEKSPSFMVSPERQTFKCFGCGEGGDIFAFYMKQEGVTFAEALKDLAQRAGVELTSFKPTPDLEIKERLYEIHRVSAEFYHYLLTKHSLGKKALEYVTERGVTSSQITDFKIGYAPNGWHSLSDFLLKKKKFKPDEVEKSGLVLNSNGRHYDRFRGRIMFPLLDVRGNITGFSGRILPWTDDGKSGKYINSPETLIYHKSKMLFPLFYTKDIIREKENVVVVEGEFDVLASLRANVGNVVAVKGSALTEDQVKLLQRFCNTAVLALDADEAGIKAAKRAIAVASMAEMNIRVVELSQGKDPDELVKSDPKKWREAVKQAVGIYDFFLDVATRQHDPKTPEGKEAISREIVPLLNQIQNKIVQAHYVKKLAGLLNLETSAIEQEMQRQTKKTQIPYLKAVKSQENKKPPRIQLLLNELLTYVTHHYGKIDLATIPLEDLPDVAVTKILKKLKENKSKDVVAFAGTLPPELQEQFDASFLRELEDLDEKELKIKFTNLISEVAKLALRDKLTELRNRVNSASREEQEKLKHQINEVLVLFRSYNR